MLRAFQAFSRPAGKLQCPLRLVQLRGKSEFSITITSSHMQRLLVPKDDALIQMIQQHPDARGVIQKIELTGRTGLRLRACRVILGSTSEKTNIDKAIKAAEATNELHKQQMFTTVRSFSSLKNEVIPRARSLSKKIAKERAERSSIQDYFMSMCSDSKEDVRRCEKYKREIRGLMSALELKGADMPPAGAIEKASKEAEELFKLLMSKCLPQALSRQLHDNTTKLDDAKKLLDEKVKESHQIREGQHEVKAGMEALRQREEQLKRKEEEAKAELCKLQAQLKEIEKRLRDYTFRKYGCWVEAWRRDVELAETEKAEKLNQIGQCEKKNQEIQKDIQDLIATKDGETAITAADSEKIQGRLKVAEQKVEEAMKEVKTCEENLKTTNSEILQECKKLGASDLEEAKMLQFMAQVLEVDMELGRGLDQSTPGESAIQQAQEKVNRLLEETTEATKDKEIQEGLDSFLENFPNDNDALRPEDGAMAAYLNLCPLIDRGEMVYVLSNSFSGRQGQQQFLEE